MSILYEQNFKKLKEIQLLMIQDKDRPQMLSSERLKPVLGISDDKGWFIFTQATNCLIGQSFQRQLYVPCIPAYVRSYRL